VGWRRHRAEGEIAASRFIAFGRHHWIADADLVSVRDPKRFEALSPKERKRWEAFWTDVRAELAKEKAKP